MTINREESSGGIQVVCSALSCLVRIFALDLHSSLKTPGVFGRQPIHAVGQIARPVPLKSFVGLVCPFTLAF